MKKGPIRPFLFLSFNFRQLSFGSALLQNNKTQRYHVIEFVFAQWLEASGMINGIMMPPSSTHGRVMNKIGMLILVVLFSGNASAWTSQTRLDEMTDKKIGFVSTQAFSGMSQWGKMPTATVRCKSGDDLEVFFDWKEFVGSDGKANVTYRFDKGQAINGRFGLSTDGNAIFAPANEVQTIINLIKKHDKLLVEVKDYAGTALPMAKFSLTGFVENYNAACGWWHKEREESVRDIRRNRKALHEKGQSAADNLPKRLAEYGECVNVKVTYSRAKREEFCRKVYGDLIGNIWAIDH